jgi:FMN-dependent NADH-azoreductase
MNETPAIKVLRIDSSMARNGSISRLVGDEVERRLLARHRNIDVHRVDIGDGFPHIDADWFDANVTAEHDRDAAQRQRLAESDRAIASLRDADVVIITAPVYNFSVPSTLKAWIDHVCRAGITFRYTPDGPQGLLRDRPVYLAMASGGVRFGSDVDFASTYLRQVLAFIGIDDVRLVGAEGVARDRDGAFAAASQRITAWLPQGEEYAA